VCLCIDGFSRNYFSALQASPGNIFFLGEGCNSKVTCSGRNAIEKNPYSCAKKSTCGSIAGKRSCICDQGYDPLFDSSGLHIDKCIRKSLCQTFCDTYHMQYYRFITKSVDHATMIIKYWFPVSACSAGQYDLDMCTDCPPGTYQPDTASVTCDVCPLIGLTAESKSTNATACQGQYA